MKEGYVIKGIAATPGDLEKINKFSRKTLSADEVYTFKLTLCDNEIDRDGERFTVPALEKLAKLFVGCTGIFDHSMLSADQTARLYDCFTECEQDKKTVNGEVYTRLAGKAYMPVIEKNRELISEIEAGIKKEVSIGCSATVFTCSICGADKRRDGCAHIKGEVYGGKVCCVELSEPSDAYEWSFVAVPAQRAAGVTKAFEFNKGGDDNLNDFGDIQKALASPDMSAVKAYVETLEKEAAYGKAYREQMRADVFRLCGVQSDLLPDSVVKAICDKLDIYELEEFKHGVERIMNGGGVLQLRPENGQEKTVNFEQFKI